LSSTSVKMSWKHLTLKPRRKVTVIQLQLWRHVAITFKTTKDTFWSENKRRLRFFAFGQQLRRRHVGTIQERYLQRHRRRRSGRGHRGWRGPAAHRRPNARWKTGISSQRSSWSGWEPSQIRVPETHFLTGNLIEPYPENMITFLP
jgi:hypothetical protein